MELESQQNYYIYNMDSRHIVGHKGLSANKSTKSQNQSTPLHLGILNTSLTMKTRSPTKNLNKSQSVTDKYDKKYMKDTSYQELSLHIRMKEKFQDLYKKIKKISNKNGWDETANKHEHRFIVYPSEDLINDKPIHQAQGKQKQDIMKTNSRSLCDEALSPLHSNNKEKQSDTDLQVNTISPNKFNRDQSLQIKFLRNTRYKPRLVSHKTKNMSNKIRDYLSIQKIRINDIQGNSQKNIHSRRYSGLKQLIDHNFIQKATSQLQTNLLFQKKASDQPVRQAPILPKFTMNRSIYKRSKKIQFDPPFETYFYRDLIWRVAYSNEHNIESPPEYQSKIKVYIGRGNNSSLIKSIIARRSWYQITDKINDAAVIWTQIKVHSIFTWQQKSAIKSSHKRPIVVEEIMNENEGKRYVPDSIWTNYEQKKFQKYFSLYHHIEQKMGTDFKFRNKKLKLNAQFSLPITTNKIQSNKQKQKKETQQNFSKSLVSTMRSPSSLSLTNSNTIKTKIHNHLINNYIIGNKKALFQTMKQYYEKRNENAFNYIPITFHVCNGLEDDQYLKFLNVFYAYAKKNGEFEEQNSSYNAWIVKPGENTNQGNGIIVCLSLDAIKSILKKKQRHHNGSPKTYIIQKYIEKPMLYKRRKFDIRHYMMINCTNGLIKGYWFKHGYLRTTSTQYTLKQPSGNIHLTNDAVQKNLPDYGKYQKGNKLSYEEFQEYLTRVYAGKYNFWKQVYPKMKQIANDIIKASANNMDPQRRGSNFEIFGLDYMLDTNMNVWLIEVNSNPCLQLASPHLAKIIPKLIQNTFQICIDPIYAPPLNFSPKGVTFKQNCVTEMDYELIYDQRYQSKSDAGFNLLNDEKFMKQEDEVFDDDGEQLKQD